MFGWRRSLVAPVPRDGKTKSFAGRKRACFLRVLLIAVCIAQGALPQSVLEFPEPPQLGQRLERAGFRDVSWQTYTGGIVAAHVATRR